MEKIEPELNHLRKMFKIVYRPNQIPIHIYLENDE